MPEASEPRKPQGYAGPKNPQKKPRSKASPARLAALDVVRAVRERDAFAQDVIGTRIDRSDLSSEDRAFATKLALGVVSSTGTLDEIIDRALNAPSDVKPDVRDALRVSAYEIVFLGKTPHAAVDQGVELVRSFAMSASGLANAVLRKIVLMRQAFPFGDPMRDPEALARLHAFPLWLARKLIADLGPQEALDFMRASNEQAPLFIAVNAAKTTDEALVKAFDKLDEGLDPVSVDGVDVAGCYRVLDTRALLLPEVKRMFSQGKILVTDAASQLVAASVLPERKPSSLLEVGAGRATKTILLQSDATRAYGSQLVLSTLDNHAFKTRLLLERAERYGAEVAEALTGDARGVHRCAMLGAGHAAPPSRDPLAHQAGRHRGVRARAAGHAPVRRASRGFGRHAGLRHVHGDARGEQRRGEGLPRKRGRRGLQTGARQRPLLRGHAPVSRLLGRPLRRPFRAHRVKPPRARCRPTLSEEVRAAYGGEGMRFCGA